MQLEDAEMLEQIPGGGGGALLLEHPEQVRV
jgi:hypothetical protein